MARKSTPKPLLVVASPGRADRLDTLIDGLAIATTPAQMAAAAKAAKREKPGKKRVP